MLGTITQKFVLSPSATMFTSEIPSNLATPLPTGGTNTPAPYGQMTPGHPGVNPLLLAATHSNNPVMSHMAPGMPGDPSYSLHFRPSSHSQTPTSVKTLKPPEYFPEWKEHANANAPGANANASGGGGGGGGVNNAGNNAGGPGAAPGQTSTSHGMEEAVFLGAQVASKVIFILDQGISKGFMGRVEYNENGPSAIHEYTL